VALVLEGLADGQHQQRKDEERRDESDRT